MLNVDFVALAKIAPATRARFVSLMADFEEFCRGVERGFKSQQLRYSRELWAQIQSQKAIMVERAAAALGNIGIADLDSVTEAVNEEIARREAARVRVIRQRRAQKEAEQAAFESAL